MIYYHMGGNSRKVLLKLTTDVSHSRREHYSECTECTA